MRTNVRAAAAIFRELIGYVLAKDSCFFCGVVFSVAVMVTSLYSAAQPIGARIDIRQYGAVPDDDGNDATAIRAAMDAACRMPGSIVYFPPGVYRFADEKALAIEYAALSGQYGEHVQDTLFKPDAPYVIALDLTGAQNVTIEAHGATLQFEGWYEAVSVRQAGHIRINGLTIDYKRPPYTEGTITEVHDDYFDMEVDVDRFPMVEGTVTGRIHFYDVQKSRLYSGAWHEPKTTINDSTIRVHSSAKPRRGDICILRHSAHYRPAILLKESIDIKLNDVVIHSQPGMGVVGHRCENITMNNLQVIPRPGSVTSTNTDATHFTTCSGHIALNACKFGGQGDDCTNIHNYYYTLYPVRHQPDELEIRVEEADLHALSLDYPDKGDTLLLVERGTLDPVERFTVVSVDTSTADWRVAVRLDKPFLFDVSMHYLTNETRRPSVEIVNNTVRSHLARAYLIKTDNVRIVGNTIQQSSGTAIQLGAEAGWRESGPVADIVIARNWIIDCGYGRGTQSGTAINIGVSGVEGRPLLLNKRLTVRDNTIQALGEDAIFVSGVSGVHISNNRIFGSRYAVVVENSGQVHVSSNGYLPVRIDDAQ